MRKYFITAIGTDSGKTLASAILCKALNADYWKPVQAGLPRDADIVKQLIGDQTFFHPERYLLRTPASPHAAAIIDNVTIDLADFSLPKTNRSLIIEGAGGCLVPLNDHHTMIDLMAALNVEIILVSNQYLGSINHTLLTAEALFNRKLKVKGIIFNGERNFESERIILLRTGLRCLLRISKEQAINYSVIEKYANQLNKDLDE